MRLIKPNNVTVWQDNLTNFKLHLGLIFMSSIDLTLTKDLYLESYVYDYKSNEATT